MDITGMAPNASLANAQEVPIHQISLLKHANWSRAMWFAIVRMVIMANDVIHASLVTMATRRTPMGGARCASVTITLMLMAPISAIM
jgi:hypothetical protein